MMVSQERHVHTGVKKGTVLELAKWPFPKYSFGWGEGRLWRVTVYWNSPALFVTARFNC
ncbi:hypothetical protein [Paenibacillus sp. FSL P2-0136]|uniref:hypothetical protein n=1 Tax=Paenibacillus sp. FSL P2-0136 TaxID=2975317 RepID=UPI0030DB960E